MNPIPEPLRARWSPMWPKDCHPERPWWVLVRDVNEPVQTSYPSRSFYRWARVDGAKVTAGYLSDEPSWRSGVPGDEALTAFDAAHPLPAPPLMPGQVWAYADGTETLIVRVEMWPPPDVNAILVAGPTPWGRDVPWSP